ncbi:MAG: hypothetical protein SF051_10240 [Elusimicrobiota bacterium]|nr:hypothetical protein [Elusimicrobiota bacterium]
MELIKSTGLILLSLGVFAGACAFVYVCLFKAKESNMPNVARGVGLFALAALLKVVLLVLGEKVWGGFAAPWLDYPLIALSVVGFFVMLVGLGEG